MDDFNMPAKDTFGSQPPLELMRLWLDYGFWYDRQKQTVKKIQVRWGSGLNVRKWSHQLHAPPMLKLGICDCLCGVTHQGDTVFYAGNVSHREFSGNGRPIVFLGNVRRWFYRECQTHSVFREWQTHRVFRECQTQWFYRECQTESVFREWQTQSVFRECQTQWFYRECQMCVFMGNARLYLQGMPDTVCLLWVSETF